MAKGPNLYNFPHSDPAVRAAQQLDSVFAQTLGHKDIVVFDETLRVQKQDPTTDSLVSMIENADAEDVETVTARAARMSEQLLYVESERESMRILIFTKNVGMRQLGSLAQKQLLELGGIFAEIHVVILNVRDEDTIPTVRLADNIWLYSTESTQWWKVGFDAYRVVREQLVFAGGFRADIIVAEDPFESGAAAYFISEKYDRPLQIHVLEDMYDQEFKNIDDHNVWRLFIAQFVLRRTLCVRTSSEFIRSRIIAEYPDLASVTEVLPIYYNLEAWRDMIPAMDLKERYPQFKFIMLHVSSMNSKSHTAEVIQGTAPILRQYPTIGLIIVGNGPYRPALEKQVIALGIHPQVEFEPMPDEIVSHMKSSNILIHLSEDANDDSVILEAATVKLPMIASSTSLAGTLFQDGESAFLCTSIDPACVSYRVKTFLNDNQARARLAINAEEAVFSRIEQDYASYLQAYRSSVERCVA